MQNIFKEYETFNLEWKKMEAKKEELRTKVLEEMLKLGGEQVQGTIGIFSVGHKVSWEYTPKVQKLEDRLKLARLNEQKRGTAKETVKEYLLYKDKSAI